MLTKLINMFQKPFETMTTHGILIHKDYTHIMPTNYRPPLARNVVDQSIQNKDDFIKFVKEYATPNTKIFFNTESIKAIFNYTGAKEADDMDIIEIAEHLHASKNVNSIVRNTQQSFVLDAEVRAGNSSFTIPRYITFNLPIYKNDLTLKCDFEVELFLSADETGFSAMLRCYKLEQTVDEATNTLTQDIVTHCEEVKSFRI